jgi:hypothetical protein
MKAALIALACLCCGCQGRGASTAQIVIDASKDDKLINRVWMRTDGDDNPGRKLIFLGNGTLVQDSCWEPYRLSTWRREAPNRVRWTEDTAAVQAEIQTISDTELVLRLVVPTEIQAQHYQPATVPYVCPDMKR